MRSLQVVGIDDDRWDQVLAETEGADLFHARAFCRFRLGADASACRLLLYEGAAGSVFDVTVVKPVASLPFYSDLEGSFDPPAVDLASPEYNGPCLTGDEAASAELLRDYRRAVDSYCRDLGAVTEFVRFHPRSPTEAGLAALETVVTAGDVVYVDLRGGYEAAFRGYRPEMRLAVRKAMRQGVVVRQAPVDDTTLRRFATLYRDTLDRKPDVKSYHHRSETYFFDLFRELGSTAILFESYAGDSFGSAAIFLAGRRHVWYMYGATASHGLASGANKYLFDRAIAWAAEQGAEDLILGGGFAPGDGLYQFKGGYSRLRAPVRHLRKVHDAGRLGRLLDAKSAFDRSRGLPTRQDYFPSYWL